jgi:hypothetical protein
MKKMMMAVFVVFSMGSLQVTSQTLAFPGAEGFGKFTTGGRGGRVIYVSNLNDEGHGSFRDACTQQGARIVLFKVSGTIFLKTRLNISGGDLTIAGQTAPGDGICIAGADVNVKADNVIIRFMRFRMGDINKIEGDAFGGLRNKNFMVDHCSMSWSTDECASFYGNQNFTLQWCIVSESLANTVHSKGPHGFGGIWGGINASFHHNLLAHHTSRNPRFGNLVESRNMDFRNNVVYNWGFNSAYGGEGGEQNYVANYYKSGPATQENVKNRFLQITKNTTQNYGIFYVADNVMEGNKQVTNDNWKGIVISKGETDKDDNPDQQLRFKSKAEKPFAFEPIPVQTAEKAYIEVLQKAGASLKRDPVDLRVINEVKTGTAQFGKWFDGGGKGIIDSQEQVGGWPELKSLPAPNDKDGDGMPDSWEAGKKQLNPDLPDGNRFDLDPKYTNLEVYLNSLVPVNIY